MKQIFDWLREQIKNRKAKNDFLEDRVWNHAIRVCIEIIDEAEAKWEQDCCEWKRVGLTENPRYVSAHDLWEVLTDAELWNVCPYCGKRIKILEVD